MPERLDPLPRALTVAWLPMKASVFLSRIDDADRAADARAADSDGEAARDQVGHGVVGGVDQHVAAGVRLCTACVGRRGIADIGLGRIVHADVRDRTADGGGAGDGPGGGDRQDVAAGVRFDLDIAQGSHRWRRRRSRPWSCC